jgi:hypothetical protein
LSGLCKHIICNSFHLTITDKFFRISCGFDDILPAPVDHIARFIVYFHSLVILRRKQEWKRKKTNMLHKEKSKLFEGNGLCILTCHVILAFLKQTELDICLVYLLQSFLRVRFSGIKGSDKLYVHFGQPWLDTSFVLILQKCLSFGEVPFHIRSHSFI